MVYLDASALAKRYIKEAESAQVDSMFDQGAPELYTSRVAFADVLSLLARAMRAGRMTGHDYASQKQRFLRDWQGLRVVEVTAECLDPADRLIAQHALRGFDAVHLCSALFLGKPDFACFDSRLQAAARAEGLAVVP